MSVCAIEEMLSLQCMVFAVVVWFVEWPSFEIIRTTTAAGSAEGGSSACRAG